MRTFCDDIMWQFGLDWQRPARPHAVWRVASAHVTRQRACDDKSVTLSGNKFSIHPKNNPCRTKFISLLFYVLCVSQ